MNTAAPSGNLLLFNLMTDRDDPILGFTTEWINALAPHFSKVFVITMARGTVSVAPNVEVHSVGKELGYSEFRRLLRFYQIVRQALDKEKIDVCFVHMISIFAVLFFPFALLRNIPVLFWYCHGATSFTLRLALRSVNRVVTCSPEGFRLPSDKVKIIGHGINTDIFKPAAAPQQADTFRLLTVGRLSPIKHCEVLINAIKEVLASGMQDLRYTLVGGLERSDSPAYEASLQQRVSDAHLDRFISFRGPVPFPQVPPLYRAADLVLNASTTGSVDKAVLEAMSSGCLVLTANPAFKQVLGDLAPLLLVPKNEPVQFAARIKKLSALSSGQRADLGARLRRIVVEHHSLQGLTARLVHELAALRKEARG
jgi:glycosyltransferase involved in cell wall biosynthesis